MTQQIEQNTRFINKFDLDKYGFYAAVPYTDAAIGFGCKKKLNSKDEENVTGIGIYMSEKTYAEQSTRKGLYITAIYGKQFSDGIQIRSKYNFNEPLDLEFRDEFFYDINTEKIYKKNKEITADDLLLYVYRKHIRTTKDFFGFILRIRLRFWRIWLPCLLKLISSTFHYLLLIISGDRYTYEFLFKEENLNGQIISSRMEGRVNKVPKPPKETEEKAATIDFFGIDVPQWPIVFYSSLHLCLLVLIKYLGIKVTQIKEFFDNNFCMVLYVIVSFWLIETVLPFILKKLIKYFSTLAFCASHKKIRV